MNVLLWLLLFEQVSFSCSCYLRVDMQYMKTTPIRSVWFDFQRIADHYCCRLTNRNYVVFGQLLSLKTFFWQLRHCRMITTFVKFIVLNVDVQCVNVVKNIHKLHRQIILLTVMSTPVLSKLTGGRRAGNVPCAKSSHCGKGKFYEVRCCKENI